MISILTLVVCIEVASSRLISHESLNPQPVRIVLQNESYDVFKGVTFEYSLPNIKSSFDQKLYQRTAWNQSLDPTEIYQRPDLYKEPENCTISGSSIQYKGGVDLYQSQSQITAFYRQGSCIYTMIKQYLTIFDLRIQNEKQSARPIYNDSIGKQFVVSKSTFFTLNDKVYLTDGNVLHLIQVNPEARNADLTKVAGFQRLGASQQMLKVDNEDKTNSIILLTSVQLYHYKFQNSTQCTVSKYSLDATANMFVDVIYNSSSIYLLDMSKGLYVMNDDLKAIPEQYNMGISENIKFVKMELHQNTIEVIFEFAREVYVVELILGNGTMYINRYYDEVSGCKDVDFIGENLFLIGESELLLVQHSVPQAVLLGLQKLPKYYFYGYGMEKFELLEFVSTATKPVLLGYNDYQLMLIMLEITPPGVSCNFANANASIKQYLAVLNSTTCPNISTGEYCLYSQFLTLNVTEAIGRKFNIVVLIASVLLVIVGLFILICLVSRFRRKRKTIMDAISKKIEELRAAGTSQKLKL